MTNSNSRPDSRARTAGHCLLAPVLAAAALGLAFAPRGARGGLPERHLAMMKHVQADNCVSSFCGEEARACGTQWACVRAGACNANCQFFHKKTSEACNLECELSYGYNSTKYRTLMQCMADHDCLPVRNMSDGVCLARDDQTITNLTELGQIGQTADKSGKWWIVRGQNCAQSADWPAGFDYFPCQRDEFVPDPTSPAGADKWIDHIAYCGGSRNKCTTEMLYTVANVSMTSPGVMTHWYTDPPLKPQTEEWRVLSAPHPDWMLYIYCGSTPTGAYAGGSVVAREPIRTADMIPGWVETIFRAKAKEFGFDYDEMCISDDSISACVD